MRRGSSVGLCVPFPGVETALAAREVEMVRLEDRPWWPELVALKDVLSLRELSERFGAAPAAISKALRRNRLERRPAPPGPRAHRDPERLAAAREALARVGPPPPPEARELPRSRIEPYAHLVGRVPDREVAEMAGVTVSAVTNWRRRRGIPAARRGGGGAAAAPRAGDRAFRVVARDRTFVVVAPDIVNAARIARERAGRAVERVELVGAALLG